VVWQKSGEVWAYNIPSEETTMVCDTGSGNGVDVWNNIVVWEDDRNDSDDIFMMDLLTSEETTVCGNEYDQGRPRIENGTIVWTDCRATGETGIDNADIWGMYLAPQTAAFAGADRYETAVAASRQAFAGGADTVVIATGANWPDALAASGLAGAAVGPVLLTQTDSVPAVVAKELLRLGAKDAYIVGGTSAVSQAVEDYLAELLPGTVSRIGGKDRYETAGLISKEAVSLLGTDTVDAIVASGVKFPDAVSASALSAGLGMPLYLTKADDLPDNVKGMMSDAGVDDVYIVGGTAVVADAVKAEADAAFGTVKRLSGADRYATSVAIANEGVELGLAWDGVGFATGTAFPDALAGGVVQGLNGSVLLLTTGDVLDPSIKAALEANKADIGLARFYGGTSAINNNVRDAITAILNS
jgi:beta propeller repeat protein